MDYAFSSGANAPLWLPPLVTFVVGLAASTAGLSGAFLIMPFQVSVLGVTAPAASATNLLFNVIAIPGGVYRYFKEGRLDPWLSLVLAVGTLPGLFLGVVIRVIYLPDPRSFKLLVACVLAFLALRLGATLRRANDEGAGAGAPPPGARLEVVSRSIRRITVRLGEASYSYPPVPLFLLSTGFGIVGGAYGVGGGAFIAPILISVLRMPVYGTAGATLLSTFVASVGGVIMYTFAGPVFAADGVPVRPDWLLGLLLGAGGLFGTYLGARLQRHLPARAIKATLALVLAALAARYVLELLL